MRVLKPTSLDLDPLACGDLGLGTHTYGGMLEPILMGSLVSLEVWFFVLEIIYLSTMMIYLGYIIIFLVLMFYGET